MVRQTGIGSGMKLKQFQLWPLLFVTLLLSACAETRFGEEVKRDPQGELPPLPLTAITDQEADTLYIALLDEPFLKPEEESKASDETKAAIPLWDKAREELKKEALKPTADRLIQQRRIGRLKHLATGDKSELRGFVLKYWLILYKDLPAEEAEKAVDVLQDKIFAEADLAAAFHLIWLSTMVMSDEVKATYTDEHRAGLIRMDKYYRTGDKAALTADTESEQPVPPPAER